MNILFVVFHFPPISGGGVIVAVDIANSLAKLIPDGACAENNFINCGVCVAGATGGPIF